MGFKTVNKRADEGVRRHQEALLSLGRPGVISGLGPGRQRQHIKSNQTFATNHDSFIEECKLGLHRAHGNI